MIRFDSNLVCYASSSPEIVEDDIDRVPTFIILTPALTKKVLAHANENFSGAVTFGIQTDHGARDVFRRRVGDQPPHAGKPGCHRPRDLTFLHRIAVAAYRACAEVPNNEGAGNYIDVVGVNVRRRSLIIAPSGQGPGCWCQASR